MPILVFKQAHRPGKLAKTCFQVSVKINLGSRSKHLFQHFTTMYLQWVFLTCCPNKALQRPKTKLPISFGFENFYFGCYKGGAEKGVPD